MPAGDKNDPFSGSRKWLKTHAYDLGDARYIGLSSVERGVLADLERFSLRSSDIPGTFLYDGEPMTLAEILRGIQPRDFDQDELNRAAMQTLRERGFLAFEEALGWALARWKERQSKDIVEADAALSKRIAAATRKRNQRLREGGTVVNVEDWRRKSDEGAR